jgi:hypothetical protein
MIKEPEAQARVLHDGIEYLEQALPLLEEMIEREQAQVLQRVAAAMKAGTLSGDMAVTMWHQFIGPEAFLTRIRNRIKAKSVILTQVEKQANVPTLGQMTGDHKNAT